MPDVFTASGERLPRACATTRCPGVPLLPVIPGNIAVPVARVETYKQRHCLSRRVSGRCENF
jgi:hypothetical protein